jgi:hypothetical protein
LCFFKFNHLIVKVKVKGALEQDRKTQYVSTSISDTKMSEIKVKVKGALELDRKTQYVSNSISDTKMSEIKVKVILNSPRKPRGLTLLLFQRRH